MNENGIKERFAGNEAKGRISKRVFQENKAHQIFRKTNISYPLIRTRTCVYQGVRNVCFPENLMCFVSLKHLFWNSPFCLITDDLTEVIIIGVGDFTKTKKEKISQVGKINILFAKTTKIRWVTVFPDWKNDAVSTLFTKTSVTVKIMRNWHPRSRNKSL